MRLESAEPINEDTFPTRNPQSRLAAQAKDMG
jgi:hypothetical protein